MIRFSLALSVFPQPSVKVIFYYINNYLFEYYMSKLHYARCEMIERRQLSRGYRCWLFGRVVCHGTYSLAKAGH